MADHGNAILFNGENVLHCRAAASPCHDILVGLLRKATVGRRVAVSPTVMPPGLSHCGVSCSTSSACPHGYSPPDTRIPRWDAGDDPPGVREMNEIG
jgi:hypothetical protein